MAAKGQTTVIFNQAYFDSIMKSAGVQKLTDEVGERALSIAQSTAPVDKEDYKRGLKLEHYEARYRRTTRVVGTDAKTLLIEAKTGNLARALKQAKK